MRLIDAEPLANKLQEHKDFFIDAYGGDFSFMNLKEKARVDEITNCLFEIQNAPTIEAKPVVHCKDCKYWCANYCTRPINNRTNMFPMSENDFCSCGAQMDESISCSHEDDNHIAEDDKKGVKIPVISMEDVPKIMEDER